MKKVLLIAVLLLPIIAMAQKGVANLTMNGFAKGQRFVVGELRSGRVVPTDTLTLGAKGVLKIERNIAEPMFLIVTGVGERGVWLHLLLLPREKYSLEVSYRQEQNFAYVQSVKGSDNMEMYRAYNNIMGVALTDESLKERMDEQMEELIKENSHLLMSAFLITYFDKAFDRHAALYKQVHDQLVGRYASNDFVRHIEDKLRTAVLEGMEAPDISLPDTGGMVPRRLSDLRGKVVLVDFWASWCGPCRRENPNVVRIYNAYHDQGFEIYSVSLDTDRDKWIEAIAQDGLIWPNHVSDLLGWRSAAGKAYSIQAIPATVLIDRDGKVVARNLRGAALEKKVKEILER